MVRITDHAVKWFDVHGARGFKRAFKRMIGELVELWVEAKPTEPNETPPTWWETALAHITLVDKVATKALDYSPLIEYAAPILLTYIK